jgi:MoaA/NifB/PqqE/SkfB family radical SAM enzyme
MIRITKIFSRKNEDPWTRGISEDKVLAGPKTLQIDLTNDCNLNCLGCWCHSDLMEELRFDASRNKVRLPLDMVKRLIDDAKGMGTEEIMLSGSGDPAMHPDFMAIVNYIKEKALRLHIITNFTLLTKTDIDAIVGSGVELITVSIWAGDAVTYSRTHPNQGTKTFYRLKENLEYLQNIRRGRKGFPMVRLYNVISRENYSGISSMFDLALDVMADHIEFQLLDTVPGKTDRLMLTESERDAVVSQLDACLDQRERLRLITKGSDDRIPEEHLGLVIRKSLTPGFMYTLDDTVKSKASCRKGFAQEKITGIDKENKLEFHFRKAVCLRCPELERCGIDRKDFSVQAKYLTILGAGGFRRKLKSIGDSMKQSYDKDIVDTIPCYIGWTFARVLPDGDVIPCCKAHKKPLGNLHKGKFREIWVSDKYMEFRRMALSEKKSHPYFREINCFRSCDNTGMNLMTHAKLGNKYSEGGS